MASVGDQLTQPEAGWRRYDDTDGRFRYYGTWAAGSSTSHYNGTVKVTDDVLSTISFQFTGTKLRIISFRNASQSPNIVITIDGEHHSYSLTNTSSENFMSLVFEKLNLTEGVHAVTIKNNETGRFNFDAIDIDSIGELLSIPPPSTGKLCNTLDEMDIGDYIVWKRDGNTHYFGGNIDGYTEVPVTGFASSLLPTKHFHYAIKVDIGLLISDRVTEHTISWDTLNSQKRIQGLPVTISGVSGVIRSLTGGVAYADENGNKSLNATGGKGCFPIKNEWDKYINNFSLNMIQIGNTLDNVWNHSSIYTWTQDTISNGVYISSSGTSSSTVNSRFRTMRGKLGAWRDLGISQANNSETVAGLRPCFEYKEV